MTRFKIWAIFCIIFTTSLSHPIDFPEDDLFSLLAATEQLDDEVPLSDYRLSSNVYPENYEIKITPDFPTTGAGILEYFDFEGEVTISFRPTENVRSVTLHAYLLEIDQGNWRLYDGERALPMGNYTYQNETHKVTFPTEFDFELEAGKLYRLEIKYKGRLDDSMAGFYRSYYNEDGIKKWIGSTQMQSISARRAFPCFDEPRYKATFDITIVRPPGYYPTIGNTKILQSGPEGDRIFDRFTTTPRMSSYLVAFVVQQYYKRQTPEEDYAVYSRPQTENQTVYAFEVGKKLLDAMGAWVDYPFNQVPEITKLDMIAVPDFSAGAMENWGAMTYRETNLLWTEEHSTVLNKQRIAAVLTHEIAHLWFGDLLTCDWWGVTWLNEGFARFFQYFGTDLIESEWNLEEQFVVEQLQGIFQMDSTNASHSMTNKNVFTPAQVSGMFSSISYNKGASIIRWIQHYMGKDKFQSALQKYIKEHQYEAVLPENLFTAFEREYPGHRLTTIFQPWTEQTGYPLVTAERSGNQLTLKQKRFFLNPQADATSWEIPLSLAVFEANLTSTNIWAIFPRGRTEYTRDFPVGDLNFYLLNVQQVGYYRVNYDLQNWQAIIRALKSENHGGIQVINRAQIVDDLFNLARAGEIEYSLVFDVTDYLVSEDNYIPFLSAFNGLAYLSQRIADNRDATRFEVHIRYWLENIYKHLGFTPTAGESHIDTLNRVNVLSWACKHKHEECINAAKEEFRKFKDEGVLVNPNIRSPVYCSAIREGGKDEFDFLWDRYKTSNYAHEQIVILQALGCTKDQGLLNSYLVRVLSEDIRPQDKSSCFSNAYTGNHENVDIVLDFLIANFTQWEPVMGNVASAISTLSGRFTREEQAEKVEKFATDQSTALGPTKVQTLRDIASRTRINIDWDQKRLGEVSSWLENKQGVAPSLNVSFILLIVTIFSLFLLN